MEEGEAASLAEKAPCTIPTNIRLLINNRVE